MRRTPWWLRTSESALSGILRSVHTSLSVYTVDDVYKLAALFRAKEDPLGLHESAVFMRGLHQRCQLVLQPSHADHVNPFQRKLFESVVATLTNAVCHSDSAAPNGSGRTHAASSTAASEVPSSSPSSSPLLQEHINAMLDIAHDVIGSHQSDMSESAFAALDESADSARVIQPYVSSEALAEVGTHTAALVDRLRELSADDVRRIVMALSMVNYKNYGHTALLARRACEVCPSLPNKELVKLFFNLQTLHVQDSLAPLVNALCGRVPSMTTAETYQLLTAMERQSQTNATSLRLVGPLVHHAVRNHLRHAPGPAFHRALLRVLSQYQQTQHQPSIQAIMRSLLDPEKDYLARTRAHDVIVMLQCLVDLQVPPATLSRYTPLLTHLETSIASMDMRDMDNLLDIVSLLPVESDAIMSAALQRLDQDAGKLTIPQLVFLLDLLSSYPPAKSHVAIVSMAFAAAVQGPAMDVITLERVLVSLSALARFSEDYVALLRILVQEKGGFRSGVAHLLPILSALKPADLDENPDLAPLLKQALAGVASHLSEQDVQAVRKACAQLGLSDDRAVLTMLSSAHRSNVRGQSGGPQSARRGSRSAGGGGGTNKRGPRHTENPRTQWT